MLPIVQFGAPNTADIKMPSVLDEVAVDVSSDLHDYRLFTGHTESHLTQVIALDREAVDGVLFHTKGLRHVSVCFRCPATASYLLIVSVHLPHSNSTDEEFHIACSDLCSFLSTHSQYDTLLGGDWNAQPGDARYDLIAIPLSLLGFRVHNSQQATRFGRLSQRELDYFWWRQGAHDSLSATPFETTVLPQSAAALGSDHAVVTVNIQCSGHRRKDKRQARADTKCRCYSVRLEDLETLLASSPTPDDQGDLQHQWRRLLHISSRASYPTPGTKYKDSPQLKELCRRRRLSSDPAERLALTKCILAQRQAERDTWHNYILDTAIQCNYDSISQVRRQHKKPAVMDGAMKTYDSQISFARAVHEHFQSKFGQPASCQSSGSVRLPAQPFSEQEVTAAIGKLKRAKTSGPSGISNELIQAMALLPAGLKLLLDILACMLNNGPLEEHRVAELCLIAKQHHITTPADFRPIALMETIHKLYLKLLITRVQRVWPHSIMQLGGLFNCQLLDSLFLATNMLERVSLQHSRTFWLSADIQGAFDNVLWNPLETSLLHLTPASRHAELHRIFHELKCHRLSLRWGGLTSQFGVHQGVLQGGTHSSQIFAFTLEALFRILKQKWDSLYPDAVNAWCYVDDCIFVFNSFDVMKQAVPWILEEFRAFGFTWNPVKTKICAAPEERETFKASLHSLHPFLQSCEVVDRFKYLGTMLSIPAAHSEEGPPLSDLLPAQARQKALGGLTATRSFLKRGHYARWSQVLRIVQVFVASRWLWFSPCIHPLTHRLDTIKSFQLGTLAAALKLFVPDGLPDSQRRGLHRLRRRAIAELLRVWRPNDDWTRCWLWRRWSYLGHVLRLPPEHPTRKELLLDYKQVRDGRAVTSSRWLLQVLRQALGAPSLTLENLHNLYLDKASWSALLPAVEQHLGLPQATQPPVSHSTTWGGWRDAFRVDVPWFVPVFVWSEHQRWHFKWLDSREGWLQLSFQVGDAATATLQWSDWFMLMGRPRPFVVQLIYATDADVWSSAVVNLHAHQQRMIYVLEKVDDAIALKILRL